MKCETVQQALWLGNVTRDMEEHLASCAQCQNERALVKKLLKDAFKLDVPAPSKSLIPDGSVIRATIRRHRQKHYTRWIGVSGGVVAAGVLAVALLNSGLLRPPVSPYSPAHHTTVKKPPQHSTDTTKPPTTVSTGSVVTVDPNAENPEYCQAVANFILSSTFALDSTKIQHVTVTDFKVVSTSHVDGGMGQKAGTQVNGSVLLDVRLQPGVADPDHLAGVEKGTVSVFQSSGSPWTVSAYTMTTTTGAIGISPPASGSVTPMEVAFWNETQGLMAVGSSPGDNSGTVMIDVTQDGGKTWTTTKEKYTGVLSNLTVGAGGSAWITLQSSQGSPVLMQTNDYGNTWSAGPNSAADAEFLNAQFAWKTTTDGLLTSTNGGQSWQQASWPNAAESSQTDVWFVSPTHAYAVASSQGGAGRMGKTIYESTDGGKSWTTLVDVPFMSSGSVHGLSASGYPSGIFFLPDGHGWMWETRGGLFMTTDGGKNWTSSGSILPETREVRKLWFVNDQTGYAIIHDTSASAADSLQKTTDGGQTWTAVSP